MSKRAQTALEIIDSVPFQVVWQENKPLTLAKAGLKPAPTVTGPLNYTLPRLLQPNIVLNPYGTLAHCEGKAQGRAVAVPYPFQTLPGER